MDTLQNNIRKIRSHLERFRAVEMGAEILFGTLRWTGWAGGLCLLWCALDNGWHLSDEWRWLGFLALLGVTGPIVWRVAKEIAALRDSAQLALRLERQNGHEQNWLVNAFHFSRLKDLSPSSLEAWVIAQTAAAILAFRTGRRLAWGVLKTRLPVPGLAAFGVLVYAALWPGYFWNGIARLAFPFASIAPQTRVGIDREFQDETLGYGQPFVLDFGIRRGQTREAALSFKKDAEGTVQEAILSADERGRFHFEFPALRKDLEWRLRVGDFETLPLKVRVLPPPQIENVKLVAHYPKELEIPDQTFPALAESMAFPEGTGLNLELALDQTVSELKVSGTLSEGGPPMSSRDKKSWTLNFTLSQSVLLEFAYQAENGSTGVLSRSFNVQSVPDLPPHLEWKRTGNGSESGLSGSSEEDFEIGVRGNDDHGIHSLALMFRKKGGDAWAVLEEKEGKGRKEWEKAWTLSAARLQGKAGERFELQVQMKDARPGEAGLGRTPVLTVSFLSKMELGFLLYGEMLQTFHEARRRLAEEYLMAEPALSPSHLNDWEKALGTMNDWKKRAENMGLQSLFLTGLPARLSKADPLLKECRFSPSSILAKRWMSEFLGLQMDWESEKRALLEHLLGKALEEERSRLKEIFEDSLKTGLEPEKCGGAWQDFLRLLRESEEHWGKTSGPFLRKTLSLFRSRLEGLKGEETLRRGAQLLISGQKTEAASLFQEWLSRFDTLLKSWLADKRNTKPAATGEWQRELEKIADRLERTGARVDSLLLDKSAPADSVAEASLWLLKSIRLRSEEITALQTAYPSLGIQGVTLLNAAQFDLQELRSWFRAGDALKAESKRKRVQQSLKACLALLKKHGKETPGESPAPDTEALHAQEGSAASQKRRPPEIRLLKPDPLSVLTPRGTLDLEALFSDDWGIREIWLLTRILDSNGALRQTDEKLWLETAEMPETFTLRQTLSPSAFGATEGDTFEIQLKCVDGDPDGARQSLSRWVRVSIRNPSGSVSAEDYFRFKSRVAVALERFSEALGELSRELQNFEKDALQKKTTEVSVFDDFTSKQNLLRTRFDSLVGQMDLFQKQSPDFPEEDFTRHLQWAGTTMRKRFEDWNQGLRQAQTLLRQPPGDFSPLLSLWLQSRTQASELQKDFKNLIAFFGTPVESAPSQGTQKPAGVEPGNEAEQREQSLLERQNSKEALRRELGDTLNTLASGGTGAVTKAERLIQSLQALGQDTLREKLVLRTFQKTGALPPSDTHAALNETQLDLWQQISLADHKLELLEPLFAGLSTLPEWGVKDREYFQSLCSLLSIFRHQFQTLKDQIQKNPDAPEKEKQTEIGAKTELRLNALETAKNALETQIQKSAWQFGQDHLPEIQKDMAPFLSPESGTRPARELFPALQEKTTLWDKTVSGLEASAGTPDSASLQQALDQTRELLKLFETPYQNLLPPKFSEEIFKNFGLTLKAIQLDQPAFALDFFKKLTAQFSELRDLVAAFSNTLAVALALEQDSLHQDQRNKALESASRKAKTVQARLEELAATLNKTPEQLQEMEALQKQWKEAQAEARELRKTTEHREDSNLIPLLQPFAQNREDPKHARTRLDFPGLDASLETLNEQTSGEAERLDQAVLRNLSEELEELEAARESGVDVSQKMKGLRERLSRVVSEVSGVSGLAGGLPELKESLKQAQLQNAEKRQKQTLASVLQSLQQASENTDRRTEEEKSLPLPEQRFRYLRALEKKQEGWDRVQDRMGRAFLQNQELQESIRKHTAALGQQLRELRQTVDTPSFESVKAETNDRLRKNEMRLLQDADIVLQGRVGKAIGIDDSTTSVISPVVGYENLTREYLKVIAGK